MVFCNDEQKKTKLAGLCVNTTEQFNFKSHKNMSLFELCFMVLKTICFIGGIFRLFYGNVGGYVKHSCVYLVVLMVVV